MKPEQQTSLPDYGFTPCAIQQLLDDKPDRCQAIRGFYDDHPTPAQLKDEVVEGLSADKKRLSPKFFYDAEGSKLFDAITELPEYYPTRTEIELIRTYGHEMAEAAGEGSVLIELGSGSSLKVRLLLEALSPAAYVPVDISKQHLLESAETLAKLFPKTAVFPVCADYSGPFHIPKLSEEAPRLVFFPGSSIGNFEPEEAIALLKRTSALLGDGGGLLIGVDLPKDPQLLNDAYNDAQGVTAAFNKNLLTRINREVGADFDLGQFEHHAFYDEQLNRIEMHLISQQDQAVHMGGHQFQFSQDETIHTESSHKYSVKTFQQMAAKAGFYDEAVWVDENNFFSIHFMRVGKTN
uniref:Histidine-specific methyltransferase SAM-dependent domain-containing protein n=1 Tax=Magnetococcus massalia (strain MO-1) TaxID=451514 RepID=A0A1S7LH86_MAGMO|nr:Conserved protein of unknown function [Candidatus Magnetococcus massalia]